MSKKRKTKEKIFFKVFGGVFFGGVFFGGVFCDAVFVACPEIHRIIVEALVDQEVAQD